jgi:hypothetical protein
MREAALIGGISVAITASHADAIGFRPEDNVVYQRESRQL